MARTSKNLSLQCCTISCSLPANKFNPTGKSRFRAATIKLEEASLPFSRFFSFFTFFFWKNKNISSLATIYWSRKSRRHNNFLDVQIPHNNISLRYETVSNLSCCCSSSPSSTVSPTTLTSSSSRICRSRRPSSTRSRGHNQSHRVDFIRSHEIQFLTPKILKKGNCTISELLKAWRKSSRHGRQHRE